MFGIKKPDGESSVPDPINCPPYEGEERRRSASPNYYEDARVEALVDRVDRLSRLVDRMMGLVGQYQVLDSRIHALEGAVAEIEGCIKRSADDLHKIQLTMSQNSQARAWVERAILAVVTASITYALAHAGIVSL